MRPAFVFLLVALASPATASTPTVLDLNRVYGTRYVHDDAFDLEHAVAICRKYLAIYCTERRLGREPTMQDAARMWNGGPNGHKKSVTLPYWEKVARRLSK